MEDRIVTKTTLDELLTASTPRMPGNEAQLRDSVQMLVQETRTDHVQKRSRRPRSKLWRIPAVGLGGLALTAGALVVDNALFPDLPIPIEYVTDTGVTVSCTAQITGGTMFIANSNAVVKYFDGRDLAPYGQKIYEYTLVLTGETEATPANLPPSNQWVPGEGNWVEDEKFAFDMSMVEYLLINTQVDLGLKGDGGELTSDCTGQLH
jgi:hypothetical protein